MEAVLKLDVHFVKPLPVYRSIERYTTQQVRVAIDRLRQRSKTSLAVVGGVRSRVPRVFDRVNAESSRHVQRERMHIVDQDRGAIRQGPRVSDVELLAVRIVQLGIDPGWRGVRAGKEAGG